MAQKRWGQLHFKIRPAHLFVMGVFCIQCPKSSGIAPLLANQSPAALLQNQGRRGQVWCSIADALCGVLHGQELPMQP